MRLGSLLWGLHSRGIVLEPAGDMLAICPIEKLEPAEVDAIRAYKQAILDLFASGRFRMIDCPGDDCHESLLLMDGEGYCQAHKMTVRFIEGRH